MSYGLVHTLHLLLAFVFIGAVFFEVLILESARTRVPKESMRAIQQGIMQRARRLMPPVVLFIFISGGYMAWLHLGGLESLFQTSFSTLLTLKIAIAISVLIHFICAMSLSLRNRMTSFRFKFIHLSVFCHMVLIVLLAKGMFYITW
ncbi:MAG: hypothetical protein R3E62_04980 [Pseudomonadales bacterium]|jgi:hypothetical protein